MRPAGLAVRIAGASLLLLLAAPGAPGPRADEIVLQSGKRQRGFARVQGAEIHLNAYGCSVAEMTRGVRRFRRIDVREIVPEPLVDDLHRRLEELPARDVERRLELLRRAQAAHLRDEEERLAAEILRVRPDQAEALKAVGGAEHWSAMRRGNPLLDPELARAVRRMLRMESADERRREAERLEEKYGYTAAAGRIERMVQSLGRTRGVRENEVLRLETEEFPGATYALYVPEDYDPLVPRPLMLALHGGGIMRQKGPQVRGSAKDAMAHFLDGAREHGWFLCCPTAVEAPWDTTRNVAFLTAVLVEVTSLWNVDLERLHLAGQGGGGDGAWFLARRAAQRFASVSVASAGKPSGVNATAGRAALWIYHGADDEVVPVEPVRKAADGLLARKADFVYCELPKAGHGLPPAAKRDLFRYIGSKRRRKANSAWPSPSFRVPLSKAEMAAYGDPAAAWGLDLPADATVQELFAHVEAGDGSAEPAARRLARVRREGGRARADLGEPLRRILAKRDAPRPARLWAAWLLGQWRVEGAAAELGVVLRTEEDSLLLRRAAEAIARIASPESELDLRWALLDVSRRYRALEGKTVGYPDFERYCLLGAAVADAIGRVGPADDATFADLEEHLVRHVLMDRRPIRAREENGEDPSGPRTRLAVSLVHAYQRLEAEKTLFDMLREAVRQDRRAALAVQAAMQRRPPR